ncbi:cytochrome b/b6 domain-containing protein [Methylogaea oryzae]|uniref:Cytochrome b561 n=1 Tax=Methylogaea oryzae TaxID=1295382 RepID=A0A8D4VRP6_9GAMM|nr:cytochrome b/b6 domain-containing protein [Methylogaea oryzae]BBL72828.1 cytochrome b561 [Methylogaea oryzae]
MNSTPSEVSVWDPLLRLFHWLLVAAFVVAYASEDDWLQIHVAAGYGVLGLLAFRLVWGLVGPRRARFTDFVRPLATVKEYLVRLSRPNPPRYLGHNPPGGWMVVALLSLLLAVTVSGLAVYAADKGAGPLAPWLGDAGKAVEKKLEHWHETFANISLALVVVHVLGVLAESYVHGENLARAMLTGRKQRRDGDVD